MAISRKAFLIQLVGGGWALASCGGGGDGGSTTPPVGTCGATIALNHGHTLTIAQADLNSLMDISYDIHGTADHTHSVTFTAAMLASLKTGSSVNATTTTTNAHNHAITERCT